MCYSVGLDIDTTDCPIPSPPFTETALSLFPVMPSTMSPWFPVAVLSPSVGDGVEGRHSSASGAAPHLRETSCAWLLPTLQTPQPSSCHAAEVPFLSPLFCFCCFRIKIHSVVQPPSAPSLVSALWQTADAAEHGQAFERCVSKASRGKVESSLNSWHHWAKKAKLALVGEAGAHLPLTGKAPSSAGVGAREGGMPLPSPASGSLQVLVHESHRFACSH